MLLRSSGQTRQSYTSAPRESRAESRFGAVVTYAVLNGFVGRAFATKARAVPIVRLSTLLGLSPMISKVGISEREKSKVLELTQMLLMPSFYGPILKMMIGRVLLRCRELADPAFDLRRKPSGS